MATLKILGAGPVKRGVTKLAAEFEKRAGHKVNVEFTAAPDISTTEAFKRAMLDAGAIAVNVASSGVYMVKLLEKLGLGEATKDRVLKLGDTVKVMEHVAGFQAHVLISESTARPEQG